MQHTALRKNLTESPFTVQIMEARDEPGMHSLINGMIDIFIEQPIFLPTYISNWI